MVRVRIREAVMRAQTLAHEIATERVDLEALDSFFDVREPIFWTDRNGTLIAMNWAEGFLHAIMLRADAWKGLFESKRDGQLLFPILALCGDENGESLLGLSPEEGAHPCLRHRDRGVLARKRPDANLDAAHG